jgi:ABC-2 type transport system permease protein
VVVLSESALVTKIYFPREILPISYVTSNFVNMLLCFLVVFVVVLASGVPVNLLVWLYLPFVMAVEYVMGLGITLIFSAFTVYFFDLQYILGVLQLARMFMTPIMYSPDIIPQEIRPIYYLNPMAPVIVAYRDVLYYAKAPALATLLHALCFGVILVAIGFFVFGHLKRGFAEEL